VVRIEDLDHARYVELARFMGYEPQVDPAEFGSLSDSKPHAFWSKRNIDQWTPQEVEEFESQVAPLARSLGYEYRIGHLADEARAERRASEALGRLPPKPETPQFWRLRRSTSGLLRGLSGRLRAMADSIDVG
jgi:hypothetical protein